MRRRKGSRTTQDLPQGHKDPRKKERIPEEGLDKDSRERKNQKE